MIKEVVLILDFGSQYNQLIARRVRENKVYCKIVPPNLTAAQVEAMAPAGLVLSGGPASVYQKDAPKIDPEILNLGIPVLGICYGMQLFCHMLKGEVRRAGKREYGRAELRVDDRRGLFQGLPQKFVSWMSHGDKAARLPRGFAGLAHTAHTKYAACADKKRKIYGVQFHPEVVHTEYGAKIIENFLYRICGCKGTWTMESFVRDSVKEIRAAIGRKKAVMALSGGVDSSVAAALLHRAIGGQLKCIFVDNGLLRKGERENVVRRFAKHFKMDLHVVDAEERFLRRLRGVTDPERKRKIIGGEFIRVFEEEAKKVRGIEFLAQGTLYPDVIESRSAFGGPSATIKTHHNVGGLPMHMKLRLIEPLRELFKDEVRVLGEELGLPDEVVWRHPFPGPGLAVRILGEVTKERCDILREVDARVEDEIKKAGLYRQIWQAFAVLLPVKSVGVMGDERTYENAVAIRAVTSQDGMTADWAKIPHDVLGRLSNKIINEVRGVNRVVYDVSSKPPATIEWE